MNNISKNDLINSESINDNEKIAHKTADIYDKYPQNSQEPIRSNKPIKSERVKELRQNHNLSQKELGKRIGVTKQAVSKWESSGSASIRPNNLKKLADALACTPDYLIGNVDRKYAFKDGNDELTYLGLPLNALLQTIKNRLSPYSHEQLNYLMEFLYFFETLSPSQIKLLLHLASAIASNVVPPITSWHPLFEFHSFNKIFLQTHSAINEIETELHKNNIPSTIEHALQNLYNSFEKDFLELSRPLQSKQKFKKSLKNVQNTFDFFIQSLSELYTSNDNSEQLITFYKDSFSEQLNKALDSDIDSLFHLLGKD